MIAASEQMVKLTLPEIGEASLLHHTSAGIQVLLWKAKFLHAVQSFAVMSTRGDSPHLPLIVQGFQILVPHASAEPLRDSAWVLEDVHEKNDSLTYSEPHVIHLRASESCSFEALAGRWFQRTSNNHQEHPPNRVKVAPKQFSRYPGCGPASAPLEVPANLRADVHQPAPEYLIVPTTVLHVEFLPQTGSGEPQLVFSGTHAQSGQISTHPLVHRIA